MSDTTAARLPTSTFILKSFAVVGWEEYARAIHLFCTGQGSGLPVKDYFSDHSLVGIGHSMGAIAMVLSTTFTLPPPWQSIIMIDPMLLSQYFEEMTGPHFLLTGAQSRRDVWPSKEEALKIFSGRRSYADWDKRVLKAYCVSKNLLQNRKYLINILKGTRPSQSTNA